VEGTSVLAARDLSFRRLGLFHGEVSRNRDVGVQGWIELLYPSKERFCELDW
jgi:hypothetical protein